MNDLEKYFVNNKKRVIYKFHHYFEIYERHFARLRGKDICVVEIGVGDGGSLQMWKDYFGPTARVVGMDVTVDPKLVQEGIEVVYGDQGKWDDLNRLTQYLGRPIDILIDDGSHRCLDQIKTFEFLFPMIADGGVYLCEDLQTSYQEQFGGGFLRPGSFVARLKELVDEMNAWAAEPATGQIKTDFTRTGYSISFYPFAVAIEKRRMDQIIRSAVYSGGVHVQP